MEDVIVIWGRDFTVNNISFRFFKFILMIKIDVLKLYMSELEFFLYICKCLNV